MIQNPYKYKGPLDTIKDKFICVPRHEEVKRVKEGLMRREYWSILAPRQTGKTTFLRLIKKEFYNAHCIDLDFQITHSNERDFYRGLIKTFLKEIPPGNMQKMRTFIDDCDKGSPAMTFFDFLSKFNPEDENKKIILLFDEIDTLPDLRTFLHLWRKVHSERYKKEQLYKYAVVVTGSVNLIELTVGANSPFNIAETLYLKDFSDEDSERLVDEPFKKLDVKIEPQAKKKLISQISGHPQLLQHACHILVKNAKNTGSTIKEKDVDDSIEEILMTNTCIDTLGKNLSSDETLKNLVKDILKGKKRKFFPYKKLSIMGAGAIKEKNKFCKIRNEVYKIFILEVLNNSTEKPERDPEGDKGGKKISNNHVEVNIKLFISYSHRDAKWMKKLETHLGILEKKGVVVAWNDQKINPGDNWFEMIKKEIDSASIAIFMVSANSLTSDFILREEIPGFLEKRQREEMTIFPVIVSDCAWEQVDWLKKMQIWPRGAKSLDKLRPSKQNEIFADIVRRIAKLLDLK